MNFFIRLFAGIGSLSLEESIVLFLMAVIIISEIFRSANNKSWLSIYKPTNLVCLIFGYYVLIGPLLACGQKFGRGTFYHGIDHRDFLINGWEAGLVSLIFILLGFYAFSKKIKLSNIKKRGKGIDIHNIGKSISIIGLILFTIPHGINLILMYINPFSIISEANISYAGGTYYNYYSYSINFLIPGILLMWTSWIKSKKNGLTVFLWLFTTLGIYVSLGFRYRIIILLISLLFLFYISKSKRPSALIFSLFAIIFISFSGFMAIAREYGRGFDLTNLDNSTLLEGKSIVPSTFLTVGFQEAGTFFTTAGVIKQTPELNPYIGPSTPILATILLPLPRALFPFKPDNTYITEPTYKLYGGINYGAGSAILGFGEYFLIGGWFYLSLINFIIGFVLRKLWNWFLMRYDDSLAQCVYILSASYVYVVISRGYLPQVVLLFFFTVAPLYFVYYRYMNLRSK